MKKGPALLLLVICAPAFGLGFLLTIHYKMFLLGRYAALEFWEWVGGKK